MAFKISSSPVTYRPSLAPACLTRNQEAMPSMLQHVLHDIIHFLSLITPYL